MFCRNSKTFLKISINPQESGFSQALWLWAFAPLQHLTLSAFQSGASPFCSHKSKDNSAQGFCEQRTLLKFRGRERFRKRDTKTPETGLYMFTLLKVLRPHCHWQHLSARMSQRLDSVALVPFTLFFFTFSSIFSLALLCSYCLFCFTFKLSFSKL